MFYSKTLFLDTEILISYIFHVHDIELHVNFSEGKVIENQRALWEAFSVVLVNGELY